MNDENEPDMWKRLIDRGEGYIRIHATVFDILMDSFKRRMAEREKAEREKAEDQE